MSQGPFPTPIDVSLPFLDPLALGGANPSSYCIAVIDKPSVSSGTWDPDNWETSPCLHMDWQGVVREETVIFENSYNLRIEGHVTAGMTCRFVIASGAGCFTPPICTPTKDECKPTHVEPLVVGSGALTLYAMLGGYPQCSMSRTIRVYKDHLDRDVDSFRHLRWSTIQDPPGYPTGLYLELPNGKYVKPNMSCGPALVHAHNGDPDGNAQDLWDTLDGQGWDEDGPVSWVAFRQKWLPRGTKLRLYRGTLPLHWATVKTAGYGAFDEQQPGRPIAETYSADAFSHKFRHETVEAYYNAVHGGLDPDTDKVAILTPP